MSAENFKNWFEKNIGADFSIFSLPDLDIHPIFGKRSLLYGSESAVKKPVLVQGDFHRTNKHPTEPGFFQIGYWGHGCNSYAIYYIRVDEWSTVKFRLMCGGVYSDIERDSVQISKFLKAFFQFEKKIKKFSNQLTAISWVLNNDFEILDINGKIKSGTGLDLFIEPDFENQLNIKYGDYKL